MAFSASSSSVARAGDHTSATNDAPPRQRLPASVAPVPSTAAPTTAATANTADKPATIRCRRERRGVIAVSSARKLGHRSAGLGDSPRRNASTRPTGAGIDFGHGGGPLRLRLASSRADPVKGGSCVSASHSATQNAYWSAAAVSSAPKCCSGAM